MRIFDDLDRDTKVPSGQEPKNLLRILIIKVAESGMMALATGHPHGAIIAWKMTEFADWLQAVIDDVDDDEVEEAISLCIEDLKEQQEVIMAERGADWNPEFSFSLEPEELVDAFLILCRGDLQAVVDRMATDRWEKVL